MAEQQRDGQNTKQGGGVKTLLIILIVAVVILIAGMSSFAFFYVKNQNKEEPSEEKRQKVINEETVDEVVEQLFEEDDKAAGVPSSYEVVMTSIWHFPDGASLSTDAYVENAKENQTDMYFDVAMSETEEIIYESPVLALGSYVDEIKLKRDLDPGTYDCILTYHLVDSEQNTLGTIDVAVTVIVDN